MPNKIPGTDGDRYGLMIQALEGLSREDLTIYAVGLETMLYTLAKATGAISEDGRVNVAVYADTEDEVELGRRFSAIGEDVQDTIDTLKRLRTERN